MLVLVLRLARARRARAARARGRRGGRRLVVVVEGGGRAGVALGRPLGAHQVEVDVRCVGGGGVVVEPLDGDGVRVRVGARVRVGVRVGRGVAVDALAGAGVALLALRIRALGVVGRGRRAAFIIGRPVGLELAQREAGRGAGALARERVDGEGGAVQLPGARELPLLLVSGARPLRVVRLVDVLFVLLAVCGRWK